MVFQYDTDRLYIGNSSAVYFRHGMRLRFWLLGNVDVCTSFQRLSGRMPVQVAVLVKSLGCRFVTIAHIVSLLPISYKNICVFHHDILSLYYEPPE